MVFMLVLGPLYLGPTHISHSLAISKLLSGAGRKRRGFLAVEGLMQLSTTVSVLLAVEVLSLGSHPNVNSLVGIFYATGILTHIN